MTPLITPQEYQLIIGTPYGNALNSFNEVKFNAATNKVQALRIKPALPDDMWALLQSGDPLGPELEAFLEDHIKPCIAYALYAEATITSSAQVNQYGVRVANDQTSQQANGDLLSAATNKAEADFVRFRIEMYNRYKTVYYVFDGVAYPPEPKMKNLWNDSWVGRNYGFYDGRWGWWLGSSFMPPFGNAPVDGSTNGVNIGLIKAQTSWNGN